MTTATDFLRSLTDSVAVIDERLERAETSINLQNARLKILDAKLTAAATARWRDALTPVFEAASSAVDDAFREQ